jgi:hypothetical protein
MNEHRSWDSHREEFASRWLNGQTPVSDDFEVLASAHIDEVRAVVVADYAVAVIFSSWLENGVWVLASMAGFVSLVDKEILTRGSFSIGNTDGYRDVEKAYFCKPAKYSDAVKEAKAEAKSRKVTSIYLLP